MLPYGTQGGACAPPRSCCGLSLFMALALTLSVGCRNAEIRVARSALDTELAQDVISRYGPADVKTSWVGGRSELRITLKGEQYHGLATSGKHAKAREVAEYVQTRPDAGDFAQIIVEFLDPADAGSDEGAVQTSRKTVFAFPVNSGT